MDTIKTALVFVLTVCFFFGAVQIAFAISEEDFQQIGTRYGVSPYLLKAIATVESRNGLLLGTYTISEVVNETQLKFLRKIARNTERSISEFKGSRAGAMGYMQIMPSTFYMYAQDGDGDGIRDPLNPYDSLATAAYFLARTMAIKNTLRATLRKYNNSDIYCDKVIALYREMEVTRQLALSDD
jgi:membrane-bound lytic murein transglycosylase B